MFLLHDFNSVEAEGRVSVVLMDDLRVFESEYSRFDSYTFLQGTAKYTVDVYVGVCKIHYQY